MAVKLLHDEFYPNYQEPRMKTNWIIKWSFRSTVNLLNQMYLKLSGI
jgi:hypothetical protein